MYDIILVNPVFGRIKASVNACNPGLAYLESFLQSKGLRCITVSSDQLDEHRDQAEVFGISVCNFAYGISRKLSNRLWDKTVIWGGWTATALAELIVEENPTVDYVILHEGEERLLRLLQSFRDPELLDGIDGIVMRDSNGGVVSRPAEKLVDLDTLPMPTDKVIVDDVAIIGFSRGCYGNCHFCQESSRMRFRSPAKTAEEIQHWYDLGCKRFYVGNANSVAGGRLLGELIADLERRDIRAQFTLVGRPNDIVRHRDVLERAFASEVIRLDAVEVGVEANTQRMLDLLGRNTTPELNKEAVSTLIDLQARHSPDTQVYANMILFSHFDMTLDEFAENVRFIGEYDCSKSSISLLLTGLPGTQLWEEMKARGFEPYEEFGHTIMNYPFSDPDVDRLFRKLVFEDRMEIARNKPDFDFSDEVALRHRVYDKLLEFHRSSDIRKSVMEFINAAHDR